VTPFDVFFGLTTVVLGLALSHLANSLQLLLRQGRRVKWAPEPILQSALMLIIIVFVWADQWGDRNEASYTVGQSLLQVLKLLAVYVATAAVLPEPGAEHDLDLAKHYMGSRQVTYGALIAGFFLFALYRYLYLPADHQPLFNSIVLAAAVILLYALLIAFRWRPLHIAALVVLCGAYAVQVIPRTIGT
jgi:hypothetical protein